MILFINGSFGVGKTTVAQHLQRQLPNSVLFDPEEIGSRLHRRLGKIWPTDDFQTYRLWRILSVRAIRRLHRQGQTVIVPMTLIHPRYFAEFVGILRRREPEFRHFTLTAPVEVIQQRLIARDCNHGPGSWPWQRVEACCEALRNSEFDTKVDATSAHPEALAQEILTHLTCPPSSR